MHTDQAPYRVLFDQLYRHDFNPTALLDWLARNSSELNWLADLRRLGPDWRATQEDLWRLYALSRVLELIILPLQPRTGDDSDWPGPAVNEGHLIAFAQGLGLEVLSPTRFSPFDCEIITATQAMAPNAPVAILRHTWPCLMLGKMMVLRAGVEVSAGAGSLNADVASNSTLYWAYRRKNRPSEDLSRGWGNNSQWRTAFRRDYRVQSRVFYNVDGRCDLSESEPRSPFPGEDGYPLSRAERIELLTHRCFTTANQDPLGPWPYEDTLVVDE